MLRGLSMTFMRPGRIYFLTYCSLTKYLIPYAQQTPFLKLSMLPVSGQVLLYNERHVFSWYKIKRHGKMLRKVTWSSSGLCASCTGNSLWSYCSRLPLPHPLYTSSDYSAAAPPLHCEAAGADSAQQMYKSTELKNSTSQKHQGHILHINSV